LPCCVTGGYTAYVSHKYRFKRGDRVRIQSGRYRDLTGVVDSAVFQKTVDYPDDYSAGYHVVLEDERVVTVRWDQLSNVDVHEVQGALPLDCLTMPTSCLRIG